MIRFIATILACAFVAAQARGQGIIHLEHSFGWSTEYVSNARLDGRIRSAAVEYRRFAPIPRVAFYDLAYPKDSTEFVALAGHALLIIAALVQDSAELPLTNVYVPSSTGRDTLHLIAAVLSHVADSTMIATFGRFRLDALYIFPTSLRKEGTQLLADFATNRQGSRIGQLSDSVPPQTRSLFHIRLAAMEPDSHALWTMALREYPGLGKILQSVVH